MVSLLSILLLLPSSPTTAYYPYELCDGDNFSANTTFESNLDLLLSSLSSKTNSTFGTDTIGSPPNKVYGLFLCRGDVNFSICHDCIQNSTRNILKLCPYRKQAIVWYDTCQFRYSDQSFFFSFNDMRPIEAFGQQKAKDPEAITKLQRELLEKLSEQAAYKSVLMFATGTASPVSGVLQETIYGLVQCTRDLPREVCYQCLEENIYDLLPNAQVGGIILTTSCNFRYEVFKFFEGVPDITLTLSNSSAPVPSLLPLTPNVEDNGKSSNGNRNVIVISVFISVVVATVLIFVVCIVFKRRSAKNSRGMANPEEAVSAESLYFELSILKVATANFSEINKLGQGGFGAVYKGTLPEGQDIAVKRLSANSKQGIEELKNELLLVAKLQHSNLVRLRGVCLEAGEKLLVYEYMPNGSLDQLLFDPIKSKELDWERRFKIIGGIARGLLYLHEESHLKVIHRDLKASNVLLDANMKPKISDFGLARLFGGEETQGITSRVVGTFGYMAPEYASRGRFSTKVDVYSYGILVLEIVIGRKNSAFKNDSERGQDILGYTWKHWRNETTLEIIDPSLGADYSRNEVLRCIQIGLLCAQEIPTNRPPMSSVFLMLNSPSMPLKDPLLPTYVTGLSMVDSDASSKQSNFGYADVSSSSLATHTARERAKELFKIQSQGDAEIHTDPASITKG